MEWLRDRGQAHVLGSEARSTSGYESGYLYRVLKIKTSKWENTSLNYWRKPYDYMC